MMGLSEVLQYVRVLETGKVGPIDFTDGRVQLSLAATGVTVIYFILHLTKTQYKLPPGPRPWPIIGNLLLLRGGKKEMYEVFLEFVEKYGDIFTFHMGPVPVVVLNSPKAVQETLLEKAKDYAGRPKTFSTDLIKGGSVPMSTENASPVWKLQRKITHAALKKFASGSVLESMLQSRSADVVELMLKEDGKPFDPLKYMTLLIYNTIVSMVIGKTFELEDEWYVNFTREQREVVEIFSQGFLADAFPILKYLPNPSVKRLTKFTMNFEKFLARAVQEHRDNFSSDDISDFIDFLLEAEKQAKEDPSEDTLRLLTEKHLLGILTDIFFAGTDSSKTTLNWVIGFCVQHPEVQAKLHSEIDDVIGRDGAIRLSDRTRLPYTEAVLHETLRMRPVTPLALPHTTACDTTLRDYTIPKGHHVWVNIWALHKNPTLWQDPHTFDPERWLDEEGKHMLHPYQYLPFSTGRRVCVGESLAKVQLLLYVAMLFQKLEFRPPPGTENFTVDKVPGFFLSTPQPYEVVAFHRQ